jgi:hypothetical protein
MAEEAWETLTINHVASKVAPIRVDTITAGAAVFAFEGRVFGYANVMVEVFLVCEFRAAFLASE